MLQIERFARLLQTFGAADEDTASAREASGELVDPIALNEHMQWSLRVMRYSSIVLISSLLTYRVAY